MKIEKDHLFFNYWSYRYFTGDVAFTLRSSQHLAFTSLRDVVNELRSEGIVPTGNHIGYLHDPNVGFRDGWDLAIAFDLYPCIEIYYLHHKAKYKWKVVTA